MSSPASLNLSENIVAVMEGDTILVTDIDESKADPVTVTWSQVKEKTGQYIMADFTIVATKDPNGKTGPETSSIIFIQLEELEEFKKKRVEGKPDFTVVVDAEFQYGQKSKDGTGRWLAYHDKKRTPYQRRFIKGAVEKGLDTAAKIAKQLGFESGETLMRELGRFFGDYLHDYKSKKSNVEETA